jgi:hypothetical protein
MRDMMRQGGMNRLFTERLWICDDKDAARQLSEMTMPKNADNPFEVITLVAKPVH